MYFAIAAAFGLIAGVLRGISLSDIADRHFAHLWVLVVAAGLRLALLPGIIPPMATVLAARPVADVSLGAVGNLLCLSMVVGFVAVNAAQPGFQHLLVGLGFNLAVIAANGGQMPGDPDPLARAGLLAETQARLASGQWSPFALIGVDTRLRFLADVIFMPLPLREPVVLSIGDIVIALGIIAFFGSRRAAPGAPSLPVAGQQVDQSESGLGAPPIANA